MLNARIDHGQFASTADRPRLIEADDGNMYVVKFPPEDTKSTFNEYACGKIAAYFGLSVLDPVVINLSAEFMKSSAEILDMSLSPGSFFATLKQVGVYNAGDPAVKNWDPGQIENLEEVADFIAFDVFVCNNDRNDNNSLLVPLNKLKEQFRYVLIDHGYCFNGPCWQLTEGQDLPYRLALIPWRIDAIKSQYQFKNAVARMRLADAEMDSILESVPKAWRLSPAESHNLKCAMVNRSQGSVMDAIIRGMAESGGQD